MKTCFSSRLGRLVVLFFLVAGLSLSAGAQPGDGGSSVAAPASADPVAAYPLTTCVVSGEKLGEMGAPYDYIHKEDGKPDRLVRFCCKACVKDFKKESAKYLAKLDDAAAPKAPDNHSAHNHTGH